MLCVTHFFVHETVNERDTAINRERHGQFLVRPSEAGCTRFVAQFSYTQYVFAIFNWETQDISVEKQNIK